MCIFTWLATIAEYDDEFSNFFCTFGVIHRWGHIEVSLKWSNVCACPTLSLSKWGEDRTCLESGSSSRELGIHLHSWNPPPSRSFGYASYNTSLNAFASISNVENSISFFSFEGFILLTLSCGHFLLLEVGKTNKFMLPCCPFGLLGGDCYIVCSQHLASFQMQMLSHCGCWNCIPLSLCNHPCSHPFQGVSGRVDPICNTYTKNTETNNRWLGLAMS